MTLLAAGGVKYSKRIARAELLASRHSFASEILRFYVQIAQFQKQFHECLPKIWGKRPVVSANGNLRSELRPDILLPLFRKFLLLVQKQGPSPIATRARLLGSQNDNSWSTELEAFWRSGLQESPKTNPLATPQVTDTCQEFLSRAFLQPYAEFIAASMLPPVSPMTVCRCPRCNSLPLLGIIRPEGDGGKRFLQCSLCSQEWEFLRILCAHCGETREEKLPVYTAAQFPYIRMEACDTCKQFLRTIDLTKDGNAIPLVDDLAAIPLTLWATENGYQRLQQNLLGT